MSGESGEGEEWLRSHGFVLILSIGTCSAAIQLSCGRERLARRSWSSLHRLVGFWVYRRGEARQFSSQE